MKIISVIPLKKSILKGDLSYFTSLPVAVGDIVSVPIRSKDVLALVTSVEELEKSKSSVKEMSFNLKKVTENKGSSIFLKEFLQAVFYTSKYFAQNKNNVLTSLIPNIFIEEYDKIVDFKNLGNIKDTNPSSIKPEKLIFQYDLKDRISIYKTLIRESFARGKSIFLVLPTQNDIEKFASQLSKGIEQFTFLVHGGLSAKKSLATCEEIITSTHPVLILGTAPFLVIPRNDIGTIILEHESSNAYKMIRRPHVDLRVFAEIFASKINAKFIMADELLRFETIGRKDTDNLNPLHPLSYRIDFGGEIKIINPKPAAERQASGFKIFPAETIADIKSNLENNKNVFIFSLRKGLATITTCKDCSEMVSCDECHSPLVLYSSHKGKKRIFVCNKCEKEKDGDLACASCGSWNLMPLGIGTDTVSEELALAFPKAKILKLDKESAKSGSGARKIIAEFEKSEGAILIGTEMAFCYFKNKAALSVVASLDSLWSIPNFRMSEKIVQIVLSIVENTKEKIILQTKNETDAAIEAIKSANLLSFVREELSDRKKLEYPPFKRFIKITHLGTKEQTVRARKVLEENFREYHPEIFSGFVTKLKDNYRTNALLKIDPAKWSLPELSHNGSLDENLLNKLTSIQPSFEVVVDPEDLL